MEVQRALLEPGAQGATKVLLALVGPAEESQRRLLVDVLKLLGAQASALREATGDPQLHGLPSSEDLSDPRGIARTRRSRPQRPPLRAPSSPGSAENGLQ